MTACVSFLSQIEGAEESQFILCCDVRFEQQCSAQTLQDLGGEETHSAAHMLGLNAVTSFT